MSFIRTRRFILIFSAVVLAGFSTNATAQLDANALLIRNVTIVSPERAAPAGPFDVSVEAGRIAAIGVALPADGLAPAQIIDGTGRFLTPGLIDSHVHLSAVPGMHGGHEAEFPEVAAAARRQIPRSYLYHGFTTLIDLIGHPGLAALWNDEPIRPRVYFCGSAPIIDGYPTHRIPLPARYHALPNFLDDPARPKSFPEGFDRADHTPAAVVERIAATGAVGVKTFWEDGFGAAKDIPVPPHSVLQELVSAAHARGLPVLVHANSEDAQRAAVQAGIDGIAHGLWTWDSPDAPVLSAPIKEILDDIITQGVAWQPTVQVLYGERDLFDPDFLTRADVRAAVPQRVLDWYASEPGQWLVEEMRAVPFVSQHLAEGRWQQIDEMPIRHVMQALAYLAANGGRLLFGSDTPSAPTYANPAGLNGRLELGHWEAAGVAPREILRAATLTNAEFFHLAEELGTIAVGKRADLLLLAENPIEGVAAYDTIEYVIVGGTAVRRASLAANRD